MRYQALVTALASFLLVAPTAFGQSFWVDQNNPAADDTGACDGPETPCETIQAAVDKGGGAGANVTIAPGTYGPVNIGGTGTALLGDGAPGDIVIQSVGGSGAISVGTSVNTFLDNLTLDGDGTSNVIALNDAREVVISNCTLRNGAAGLALNDSSVELVGAIDIEAGTGVGVRALSTLLYNAGAPQMLTITGPGNGTGVGIQVDSGAVALTGDVEITGYQFGIIAEGGASVSLGSQAGSRIHGNTFGAFFRGAHARLAGVSVDANALHGIIIVNGANLELSGAEVVVNGANGLLLNNNASALLIASTIENNIGNGLGLSTLSSVNLAGPPFFPPNVLTGNSPFDVSCQNTSRLSGDPGAALVDGCEEPDLTLLQTELDALRDRVESHTHPYLTGTGPGHNANETATGPPLQ